MPRLMLRTSLFHLAYTLWPVLTLLQDIDWNLVDKLPEPTVTTDDSSNYSQQATIDSFVSKAEANSLPQGRDADVFLI